MERGIRSAIQTITERLQNPASQLASVTRSNDSYAWSGHAYSDRDHTANGLNQYSAGGIIVTEKW